MVQVYSGAIDKSEVDKCEYRFIVLPNKLKALLVHEPDCDKATAALDVHVGNHMIVLTLELILCLRKLS